MKLAVVSSTVRGEIDTLMSKTATRLQASGARLSGVAKVLENNQGEAPDSADDCDMDLRVLPDGPQIRITQSLGQGSRACRLNPVALTQAVAAVEQNSAQSFDLFILNKFGPQEAEGHGFCAAIGAALERDIPVLVGVASSCREAFDTFAEGMAEDLQPDAEAIHKWCLDAMTENFSEA